MTSSCDDWISGSACRFTSSAATLDTALLTEKFPSYVTFLEWAHSLLFFWRRQQLIRKTGIFEDGASPAAAGGSREVGRRDARDDGGSGGC